MERRQVDLGIVEILDAVRESEEARGPRRSKAQPKTDGTRAGRRKQRPGVANARPGAGDEGELVARWLVVDGA